MAPMSAMLPIRSFHTVKFVSFLNASMTLRTSGPGTRPARHWKERKTAKWYRRRICISHLPCGPRKLQPHIPKQRDRFQVPDGPSVEDCCLWWLAEEAPAWRTSTALYKTQLDQDSTVVQKGTNKLVQFSTKSLKLSRDCNCYAH